MKALLFIVLVVVCSAQPQPTMVRPDQVKFSQLRWTWESSSTTRITTDQVSWGIFINASGQVCYNSLANSGAGSHGNEENWYLSPSCWDSGWVEVLRQTYSWFADILKAYGK